jgi:hypothetical protein
VLLAALVLLASPLFAPQLLAFPHRAETPIGTVWSTQPIERERLLEVADETSRLLAASPLASGNERRPIFLTDGGWRWQWLALGYSDAFAITRPLTKAVVTNAVSIDEMAVRTARPVANRRNLAPLLAHEFTHGLIRRRYGEIAAYSFPTWKVEGYCDHIAQESSLTPEQALQLEEQGKDDPALIYIRGRERVAQILASNGGSVDTLFLGPVRDDNP